MTQLISEPTRVTPNSSSVIDHIYTSNESYHIKSGVLCSTLSDHYAIYSIIRFKQPHNVGRTIQIRSFNEVNIDLLIDDIVRSDIFHIELPSIVGTDNLDFCWTKWLSTLTGIIDSHVPNRTIRVKNRFNPWFDKHIQEAIYQRNYFHQKAIKYKDTESWTMYRKTRNYVTFLIRRSKSDYYNNTILSSNNNSKQMWKSLKEILPSKSKQSSASNFSPDQFNTYFSKIGNNLESHFPDTVSLPHMNVSDHTPFQFDIITQRFIKTELLKLKSKSMPDVLGMHGSILSIIADVITPSLYVLFNCSLSLGYVPGDWKLARVTPLYKGKGSRDVLSNYRPISVISHIPKIIEKHVNHMLNKHLSENSLLLKDQFAYIKSQSTINALHTVVDTALSNINNGLLTGIVQLDLRKGFDTLNHKILLYKLEKYGIHDNCLAWFKSYLHNRSQLVCSNGISSSLSHLSIGVPQGTILGPTLFVVYVNDFSYNISPFTTIRYADDTSLIAWGKDITEVQCKLQSGTNKAVDWLMANRLLLNNEKSTCMLIGTRQRLSDLSLNICISGKSLENCTYTKLLGVYIDCHLTWDKHINYLCNKLSPKLGLLYRFSKFLPNHALNVIYNTLLQPDIDYGISIWGNCGVSYLNRVQKIQNRAARIICNNFNWDTRSSTLLSMLGFMSVDVRRDYFAGILIYKTLHGFGLYYLSPLLIFTHEYHQYNTRAANNNILVLSKPKCEIYKTSLQYYGLDLWNCLPDVVKNSENVQTFKINYRNHLFCNT